jgi:hypothetical protein
MDRLAAYVTFDVFASGRPFHMQNMGKGFKTDVEAPRRRSQGSRITPIMAPLLASMDEEGTS